MTLSSLMSDLQFFAVFLLIGFVLHEVIRPIQKLFLPASLVGGTVALILGQQVLGVVTVPESFSSFASVLIDLVMAALVFGVAITKDRLKQYGSYSCMYFVGFGLQGGLGIALGALLSVIWSGMPVGWGVMGVYSFNGGPGSAATVGASFEDLGIIGNRDIGMLLATVGIVSSMVVGMIVVNYGVRRGWATYVKEVQSQPDWFYRGLLPKEQRKPIGTTTVNGFGINALAFQFAILVLARWVGIAVLRDNISPFLPIADQCPTMMWSIVGSCIVWAVIKALKLEAYVDVPTIKSITGLALEIVILTSISTLSIELLSTYLVPLVIYCAVMLGATLGIDLFLCKRYFKTEWFENCMMLFGRGAGVTANGLALVRAMDPESKSDSAAAEGPANVMSIPFNILIVLWPMMLVQGQTIQAATIGFVIFAVAVICLILINHKRK